MLLDRVSCNPDAVNIIHTKVFFWHLKLCACCILHTSAFLLLEGQIWGATKGEIEGRKNHTKYLRYEWDQRF